uniref:CRAL-TRIO domain-containing protein n=1 Tax=Glossina brevipalpis TaxID=37001 RepID=A0A1A9WKQ6_9MUSC
MKSAAAFRKENANLLHGLIIEQIKEKFLNSNVVNVLKNCDQHGRRVLIVNCGGSWDPSYVSTDDVFRILYLVHIAAQLEPETQVRGAVVVMDFEGLSMKQVTALTPTFSKRLLTFIQDAMPIRLKELHFVKQPFIFKLVWTLFKPFVREKLNKRMFHVVLTNNYINLHSPYVEHNNTINMSKANSEEAFNIRIGYMRPETIELAKNELRETPEVKQTAIMELRQLLHACPDLHYKDDDEFLIIFLRTCHFYPESAFEKVSQMYAK